MCIHASQFTGKNKIKPSKQAAAEVPVEDAMVE